MRQFHVNLTTAVMIWHDLDYFTAGMVNGKMTFGIPVGTPHRREADRLTFDSDCLLQRHKAMKGL